jgi:outer membrane protein with beta-barrel domain
MKKWIFNKFVLAVIIITTLFSLAVKSVNAREGFSVGAQGLGNFFLTNGGPNLDIGPGGGLFFDYRFNQRWSIETDLFFSFHDGEGAFKGDNNMLLLGVPTVELKFYFRGHESSIDPYALAGLGVYVLTEGSINNNSSGFGLGGNIGLGSDFYVMPRLSLGVAVKFRPIALIQANNASAGLINLGAIGSIAWHF